MSDQWGPGDGRETQRIPWSPDGPVPRPVQPEVTLESGGEVRHGSGGIGPRLVAGVIGVLVLLGGTAFAVTQLGSSGPGSPEAAVQELLDAASDEDVLGLLAALDPGERDPLRAPVEDLFDELERLEVVDSSFELTGVSGVDLSFDDVELRSVPVRDDLVRVYFTGGTVTTGVNADELPIGDFVDDTLERFGADISGLEESETTDIDDDETFVVARNGSDGWRVSIGYTAAEAARLRAGLPLHTSGITPIGADSPEAAVEGLAQSVADLDLSGMIARLTPGEFRALQDYAGLFIDDAEAAIAAETEELDITIEELTLRSDASGDRASVFVDSIAVTATFEGDEVSASTDGECLELTGDLVEDELFDTPFADGPLCAEDAEALSEELFSEAGFTSEIEVPDFPEVETPEIGIATVRIDGQWYVAPVSTYLDATVAVLRDFEREHLDAIVDMVEQLVDAFSEGITESFDGIGSSLEDDFYEPGLTPDDFSEDRYEEHLDDEFPGEAPTTTLFGGGTASFDEAALQQLAVELGPDEAGAKCLFSELSFADPDILFELIDAWQFDYEPSPGAQDVLFTAIDYCAAATG